MRTRLMRAGQLVAALALLAGCATQAPRTARPEALPRQRIVQIALQ
ncbi:hypothetical protein L602_001400000010, partial [Cupriavidus gilardii J11]